MHASSDDIRSNPSKQALRKKRVFFIEQIDRERDKDIWMDGWTNMFVHDEEDYRYGKEEEEDLDGIEISEVQSDQECEHVARLVHLLCCCVMHGAVLFILVRSTYWGAPQVSL